MSHQSAVGDQRKYQQKGSELTVQLCHWAKLVTLMLVLFEEAFIKQLWMTGPSFIFQAEEQVPEVDSGDALSHKLPGASSTWASRLGGAWPRALESKTVQAQERYLVDRFYTNLTQFKKEKEKKAQPFLKTVPYSSPLHWHPEQESPFSFFSLGRLLPVPLGWLLSVWSEPAPAAASGTQAVTHRFSLTEKLTVIPPNECNHLS